MAASKIILKKKTGNVFSMIFASLYCSLDDTGVHAL